MPPSRILANRLGHLPLAVPITPLQQLPRAVPDALPIHAVERPAQAGSPCTPMSSHRLRTWMVSRTHIETGHGGQTSSTRTYRSRPGVAISGNAPRHPWNASGAGVAVAGTGACQSNRPDHVIIPGRRRRTAVRRQSSRPRTNSPARKTGARERTIYRFLSGRPRSQWV